MITKDNCIYMENDRINSFILLMDKELVQKMHKEYIFYSGLTDNLDNLVKYLQNNFSLIKPLTLPYNTDLSIVEFYYDTIIINDSYTKPVFITVKIINNEGEYSNKRILFKKESLMNDVLMINLINISDEILRKYVNNKIKTFTYNVMPLSKDSGMIEIVQNAETIHSIHNKQNKTILE